MTRETVTIAKPVTATLWVQDRDPFAERPSGPSVNFGTTVVEPGTYEVEEIDPPDPSVGLWSGAVTVVLERDAFAEIDWDDLTEAL